ncbi:ADP-ribosylglycohydrolase family protein [Leptospira koniambonensis]|uniref:ADP-ribosylglycohydrolase family protein n=1 Tax=Leptospira koniambonensis TaxID=2484950 RepID=A0A4R9JAE8_9LEPT|nr:ADP-ribosylglycohydrolase family protein [Leptospira koniambonensis]TGL34841.1 ADP-ribosylglycohydrolase family protein [Leptospira koniambonensis]
MKNQTDIDRFSGSLLGLACGDAIGASVEFLHKGSFPLVTDMLGGGIFNLKPGQWTDDTSMALCLAKSLIHCNGFNPVDQMNRYCNWMEYGYLSSTGECFDIGSTTANALGSYLKTKDPYSGSDDVNTAGNGSLMRICPIPLYFFPDFDRISYFAGESSRTTHAADECIDACKLLSVYIGLAIKGLNKNEIFQQTIYSPATPKIQSISKGSFAMKSEQDINPSGYVVHSLETALWSFYHTSSFKDAILMTVNFGGDADTTGAICGQLAGAYYSKSSIPISWLEKLTMRSEIEEIANQLVLKNN